MIGFTSNGNVGTNGIEASYNSILNGTDGREYGYQDESASLERTVKEPESGSTVVSTIDLQVQSVVEKHILKFNEKYKNNARNTYIYSNTAVMVMNPQNGEILAEASYPNYDLNEPRDLTLYYSEKEIEAMSDEEKAEAMNKLWNNFCVNQVYERDPLLSRLPYRQDLSWAISPGMRLTTAAGSCMWEITISTVTTGRTRDPDPAPGHGEFLQRGADGDRPGPGSGTIYPVSGRVRLWEEDRGGLARRAGRRPLYRRKYGRDQSGYQCLRSEPLM